MVYERKSIYIDASTNDLVPLPKRQIL